jgi:CPA1 family monovalent cation:H+ antiporter
MFGHLSVLQRKPRRATVRAVSHTMLLTLQEAEFVALMAQVPDLAAAVKASAEKRGVIVDLPAPSGPQAARHLMAKLRTGLRPAE